MAVGGGGGGGGGGGSGGGGVASISTFVEYNVCRTISFSNALNGTCFEGR